MVGRTDDPLSRLLDLPPPFTQANVWASNRNVMSSATQLCAVDESEALTALDNEARTYGGDG